MKRVLIIIGITVLAAGISFAAINDSAGGSALAALKIGIGARSQGMGGAFTAVSDDVSAIYHNPAGLAQLDGMELSFQHLLYIEDINYANVSVASPSEFGTIGFSFSHLWMDGIEGRESAADAVREFDASDSIGTLSYSRKMEKLSLGLGIKLINSKIDDASATAFGVDIGGLYELSGTIKAGLVVQNLGGEVKYDGDDVGEEGDALPLTVKLGMSCDISGTLLALDINMPNDNSVNVNLGGEYVINAAENIEIPLRLGYSTLNDFDTIDGLSAGFGVKYNNMSADFAWTPFGDLGDTFRTSLKFGF